MLPWYFKAEDTWPSTLSPSERPNNHGCLTRQIVMTQELTAECARYMAVKISLEKELLEVLFPLLLVTKYEFPEVTTILL